MGRYTTVQAYSDNNPKLVHVSYDQAKGKSGDEEGKAGGKLVTEKTDQVMGSCAGAGSGEFHTYRAHRRREMHRVAVMDEESKNEEATAKLQAAIEQGKNECEERTRKKAEKRKRKKKAARAGNSNGAKQAKTAADGTAGGGKGKGKGKASSSSSSSGGATGGSSSSDGAAEEGEEFVYIPEADLAAAGGDGGSGFKNDGSFLEMMKKELEKSGVSGKPSAAASAGGNAVAAN